MLKVDLSQLAHGTRLRIDARVPGDAPLWEGSPPDLADGLEVDGEARLSGEDVLVRATLAGTVALACRRCLAPVRVPFHEPVTILYRRGTEAAGEAGEVYPLAQRARELDLGPAIREHALLAVPEYALCRDDCAGLCPICGADRNRVSCACGVEEKDERWAALKRLRPDG